VCAWCTVISAGDIIAIECPNTHGPRLCPFVLTYHRRSAPDTVLPALLSPPNILHKTEYDYYAVIVGVTRGKRTHYDRCSNFRNCYSTKGRERGKERKTERKRNL